MADGWTVAETAQPVRPSSSLSNRIGGRTTPTLKSEHKSTLKRQHSGGSGHHVRWSDTSSLCGNNNTLTKSSSQEDLDKLLDGLEQLTQTLPDLGKQGSSCVNTRTRGEGASPPSTPVTKPSHGIIQQNNSINNTSFPARQQHPSSQVRRKEDNNPYVILAQQHQQNYQPPLRQQQQQLQREEVPPARPELPHQLRTHLSRQDIEPNKTEEEEEVVFPNVKQTRQLLQSRDTYDVDGSSYKDYYDEDTTLGKQGGSRVGVVKQPYHTLKHSKPFSYIRSNSDLATMIGSRNVRRSNSREVLASAKPGLESPGLIRKVMGGRDSHSEDKDDSFENLLNDSTDRDRRQMSPLYHSTPKVSREENKPPFKPAHPPTGFNNDGNLKKLHSPTAVSSPLTSGHQDDFEATASWLERQQKKLMDRREIERRRGVRVQQDAAVVDELKSNIQISRQDHPHQQHPNAVYQTKSETTTDGYASDLASMLHEYSETSTRESSPHKTTMPPYQQQQQKNSINIPVKIDPAYHQRRQQLQQKQSTYTNGMTTQNYNNYNTNTNATYELDRARDTVESQMENYSSGYQSQYGSSRYQQYQAESSYGRQQAPPSSSSYGMYGGSSLTRQKSDTSFDRTRPFISRRPRHDSGSESDLVTDLFGRRNMYGSNTSIDSGTLQWGGPCSQPGSRPITPAFPSAPPTPLFGSRSSTLQHGRNGRAASPAGSLYNHHMLPSGRTRTGSISSAGDPADVPVASVRMVKDSYRYWYKPDISREDAIAALRHRQPGAFIVRDSNSFPGAFGLALKVSVPPANGNAGNSAHKDPGAELVRHFLIEPTSKGVRLKGYANEPVFGSLSALVYQHTVTQLALPERLVLPQTDLTDGVLAANGRRGSTDSAASQMQQLLAAGAACNVKYLLTYETDALTGPVAVRKATNQLLRGSRTPKPLLVHFKVGACVNCAIPFLAFS